MNERLQAQAVEAALAGEGYAGCHHMLKTGHLCIRGARFRLKFEKMASSYVSPEQPSYWTSFCYQHALMLSYKAAILGFMRTPRRGETIELPGKSAVQIQAWMDKQLANQRKG